MVPVSRFRSGDRRIKFGDSLCAAQPREVFRRPQRSRHQRKRTELPALRAIRQQQNEYEIDSLPIDGVEIDRLL